MNTTENSSPGAAKDRGGGASAPAGRRRVRGWRPRTTRAKAGLAVVAAVGATGLALALVAGPAGASTKPVWAMTAGNVQSLSGVDASTASYFFNTAAAYGAGASLVKTPVQAHYATTPVLSYTSQAQFASDIQSGSITYPYKWVMYDPENWTATPVNEQQDPVKYMTLFGQLAHANGLKVIQAPALDLATVTGSVLPRLAGESANAWFARVVRGRHPRTRCRPAGALGPPVRSSAPPGDGFALVCMTAPGDFCCSRGFHFFIELPSTSVKKSPFVL